MIPNFEWDLAKARENVRKHGISFEEAASVFGDDDAIIEDDVEHSDDEDRFIIVGISAHERVLCAVYTIRYKTSVRIISCRHPTRYEKRAYEERKAHRARD